MNRKAFITWLACALMTISSLLAYSLTPRTLLADTLPAIQLDKDFPASFGEWHLDPRADLSIPNPQIEGVIKSIYTDTLSRVYLNKEGRAIYLSVAYGRNQSDGQALHYPEVCYPAQGFVIANRKKSIINIDSTDVPVKLLIAERGPLTEPITYWATVGSKIILSGTQHKIAQLSYGFRGFIPDGMIIRVSSIGTVSAAEYAFQRQFLEDLVRNMTADARYRIMGDIATKSGA